MQWILSIPVIVAVAFSAAAALLRSCGFAVHMVDPVTAGTIAVIAGMVGASIPLFRRGELAEVLMAGLLGTVLHLVVSIALTIAAVLLHVVDGHGPFLFWVLGGYWISMFTLIWLARRVVNAKALKATPI